MKIQNPNAAHPSPSVRIRRLSMVRIVRRRERDVRIVLCRRNIRRAWHATVGSSRHAERRRRGAQVAGEVCKVEVRDVEIAGVELDGEVFVPFDLEWSMLVDETGKGGGCG